MGGAVGGADVAGGQRGGVATLPPTNQSFSVRLRRLIALPPRVPLRVVTGPRKLAELDVAARAAALPASTPARAAAGAGEALGWGSERRRRLRTTGSPNRRWSTHQAEETAALAPPAARASITASAMPDLENFIMGLLLNFKSSGSGKTP